MKARTGFIITGLMLGLTVSVWAQPNGLGMRSGQRPGGPGMHQHQGSIQPGLPEGLTVEQKEQIRELIQEMRRAGASRQEIKHAVGALLQEWGFEPPMGDNSHPEWMSQLSEEQRQQIRALVKDLKASGATRQEIHAAVTEMLGEWGIEAPQRPVQNDRPDLSDDQRQELQELIESMREQDKSRKEIHQAVSELFESWGLEAPQRPKRPGRAGKSQMPLHQLDLTEEQRAELSETIRTLRQAGATRVEIRNAVKELLEAWGVTKKPLGPENSSMLEDKKPLVAKNYPNPFNPSTQITFTIQQDGPVQIQVYNIQGQLIRTLLDEYKQAGTHHVNWNGLDQKGVRVASGTYVYRITTSEHTLTQQMTLTK